ncbi:probable WRKY transcription factor 43 [Phalaenopsis equestris]|uniref:probable WRKY transcription factor 43 n=1 Tax=Phalaenopsis equestris TaxID=78828 RepID=UPI0009E617E9|nr:probable WRKY transcription factor 43 [Phalaenopsis equestris]
MEKYNITSASSTFCAHHNYSHSEAIQMNNLHTLEKKEVFEMDGGDDDDVKGSSIGVSGGKKKKGEKKVRRPRFAFQTRSQVDILDDGYRWRKYGQKAVKNNNFPRSYYRCTHQGCSVKKQVQRLSKDDEVVVTTYEGVHTHPIERNNDNFEQILNQMQIYTRFY